MAIDTEQKRKSAATVAAVWLVVSVVPSGIIAQADRQHIGWSYSGILAAAPAIVEALAITQLVIEPKLQATVAVDGILQGSPGIN